ncbi:MAG: tRNA (uridine(34)/cytosine(34)/5-carboxymethylaminomethyluridine(34)-2'-O)-methyltransferase TrmL [Spirochaetales bacterium]|nr:tRNA (uridine(34)/cytosine(34)/5-carboxymethylaminomethyluridine(34)-2'-O)-methyltransferase TrmL [Spirochaetales bacterium]
MELNIVLHEPEIPQNTGNIARTCAAVGASLHLIEPLGFKIDDKNVRRAGLDYWDKLDVKTYKNLEEFFEKNPNGQYVFGTTKGRTNHAQISYEKKCYIFFGKESKGLPEELLIKHPETCVRIPMKDELRSLNLSNCVAIMVYEALRQNNFESLSSKGELHNLHWSEE